MIKEFVNITDKEVAQMTKDAYILVDIRDEASVRYGMIPDAINIPQGEIEGKVDALGKDKKIILYCTRGIFSKECAELLRKRGIEAYSLEGGYTGWLLGSEKESCK
ncbi:MAG: rhodanese-like domain-containing protein [Lachnospiraceae bacterium]